MLKIYALISLITFAHSFIAWFMYVKHRKWRSQELDLQFIELSGVPEIDYSLIAFTMFLRRFAWQLVFMWQMQKRRQISQIIVSQSITANLLRMD